MKAARAPSFARTAARRSCSRERASGSSPTFFASKSRPHGHRQQIASQVGDVVRALSPDSTRGSVHQASFAQLGQRSSRPSVVAAQSRRMSGHGRALLFSNMTSAHLSGRRAEASGTEQRTDGSQMPRYRW